jgi:teichuronic acid biosynthesis glycosyltransferase TuaG
MAAVTVITPFRDAARFLPGLVDNLRRQTMPHWHCLLIDHGSLDQGAELAEELIRADPRFRLLRLSARIGFDRQLPAIPRNRGLAEVETPLVAFLDVDDLWHPQKLERQLAFHQQHALDLSVTSYCCFRDATRALGPWRCPPARVRPADLRWRNPIPMLTVIASTTLLSAGFPLHPHEDYLLWLELWRDRPAFVTAVCRNCWPSTGSMTTTSPGGPGSWPAGPTGCTGPSVRLPRRLWVSAAMGMRPPLAAGPGSNTAPPPAGFPCPFDGAAPPCLEALMGSSSAS